MMNLDQFFPFLEPSLDRPTLNNNYVSQSDNLTLQSLPQPSRSNQSLSLLRTFCSDEDTVKSYLIQDEDELNTQNHGQFSDPSLQNSFTSNGSTNISNGSCAIESLVPVQVASPSNTSTDHLVFKTHYDSAINNPYDNLKSNFIFLVESGYKLTLSLNTDNSELEEPWNPDVGQKILAVYFSSLSLRSEFMSDDKELDGFESLLMDEALAAFKGQKNLNLFANMDDKSRARASPGELISICNGIKGYRKIDIKDKIMLLKDVYFDLNLMQGIINYDATVDGWDTPASDFKFDRRDLFIFSKYLHDGIVHVIETFPERLRNDINVIILLYLIITFNPDAPKLKYPQLIRHEQYSYIYLLRRYLRTVCKSDCEASDNHYTLMLEIERVKILSNQTSQEFFGLLNESLEQSLTRAITS